MFKVKKVKDYGWTRRLIWLFSFIGIYRIILHLLAL